MRPSILWRAICIIVLFTASIQCQVTVETITSSFNASGGVSIDDSGIVYVADFGITLGNANGTSVYKVYPDSSVVLFATGLQGASGNAFDSQGNLFQSNIAGNFLSKITPDGTVSVFATTDIIGPVGVAVADGDTIYVADCGASSITRVNPDGTSAIWVTSGPLLLCPNGLTIDTAGNLYTCNFNNGNIVKITPDKDVSVLATLPGGRCGHLTYFEDNLYAVARCAQKIYKVTLDGDTSLIAGTGARGNDDGPGHLATFNHANGIEAIRDGDNVVLYLNDAVSLSGSCTGVPLNPIIVRKITIGPLDINDIPDADSSLVILSDSTLQINGIDSATITITPLNVFAQAPASGIDSVTLTTSSGAIVTSPAADNLDGTFSSTLISPPTTGNDTVAVSVTVGGTVTELTSMPVLYYWVCGDADGNGLFQGLIELNYLVNYVFRGGPLSPIPEAADVNNSGGLPNLLDLNYMVNYVFRSGPAPNCP